MNLWKGPRGGTLVARLGISWIEMWMGKCLRGRGGKRRGRLDGQKFWRLIHEVETMWRGEEGDSLCPPISTISLSPQVPERFTILLYSRQSLWEGLRWLEVPKIRTRWCQEQLARSSPQNEIARVIYLNNPGYDQIMVSSRFLFCANL